jgi:endonuclease YncB( thermonuclease family)
MSTKTKLLSLCILASISTASAYAGKSCAHDASSFNCVTFVDNYDANSLTINIDDVHPIIASKVKVDIKGVLTPSITSKNKCEKQLAKDAKKFVKTFMKSAKEIRVTELERERKFAFKGKVIADGKDLGDLLLNKKFAVKAEKKLKSKDVNWCKV